MTTIGLTGCAGYWRARDAAEFERKTAPARAMMNELCKTAGEKIYRTVDNVEGIVLLNVRPKPLKAVTGQWDMVDPYGEDYSGLAYIQQFLGAASNGGKSAFGYRFVEVVENGQVFKYSGVIAQPWLRDKSYRENYYTFESPKIPVERVNARYGVEYEDISTPEQRSLWIAGSSLRVRDLATGELIAERVGYMVDLLGGDAAEDRDPRDPWGRAAESACPGFRRKGERWVPAFVAQRNQTSRFAFKVVKPVVIEK